MKQSRFYTVIILMFIATVGVAVEKISLPITIDNKSYSATIAETGYLSSIKVNGNEYLAEGLGIPGGFYLCAGGIPPLKTFTKTSETRYEGQNQIAKVSYTFDSGKILVNLSDVKKKGSLYILINKAVKKVNFLKGSADVPTIASTPAKSACDQTRWFLGETSLDIVGSDRIWGPWKEHQVWEVKLKPEKDRTITIIPGVQKPITKKAVDYLKKKIPVETFTYTEATLPAQVPLCMIGDSITWAGKGDYWRKYLLEIIPRLAFVGTHTATLGYSHAGEGGNSTSRVLGRLDMIPDCPYYSLLIGTNDTGVKDASKSQKRAIQTAERIQKIVMRLLNKKGVKKVFLCSILPCFTKNPLRDKTNSWTNVILREKMKTVFPKDKVVWIEFEKPIRAIKGWEPKIKLHPTLEGYKIVAKIHAEKIAEALKIDDLSRKPKPKSGTGVRIHNLWDKKAKTTSIPIIAGWYTISFNLNDITGKKPELKITSTDQDIKNPLNKSFKLSLSDKGKRANVSFFTGYEGYGYTRSYLTLEPVNCKISNILFEKSRPSKQPSTYGDGVYIDTQSKPALGELIELTEALWK